MFLLLFLSIDSFVGAISLGLLGLPSNRRREACLLFGVYDGLATLAGIHLKCGLAITISANHPWIVPAGICAWMLFVAFLMRRLVARRPTSTGVISLVPVILSIDNFVAGPVLSGISRPTCAVPLLTALLSATLAAAGFEIAARLENQLPRSIAIGLGAGLLLLAPIAF